MKHEVFYALLKISDGRLDNLTIGYLYKVISDAFLVYFVDNSNELERLERHEIIEDVTTIIYSSLG